MAKTAFLRGETTFPASTHYGLLSRFSVQKHAREIKDYESLPESICRITEQLYMRGVPHTCGGDVPSAVV